MGIQKQKSQQELEICSECGSFVDELNSVTGWCESCSRELGWLAPTCPNCDRPTSDGKVCSRCKYISWLERNADKIETVMAVRIVSVRIAKKVVEHDNRPTCLSCGNPIKGGQKDRHYFCTKNPECIKAHNAYSYHIRHKPHSEALTLAITASVIYRLTANISNRS